MTTLGYGEESVSVAVEDVKPQDWGSEGLRAGYHGKPDTLYKKPGYTL